MVHFVNDPQFGKIVDFEWLHGPVRESYDRLYPVYDILASSRVATEQFGDEPSYTIAGGASMLAWMMLLAAEEYELAEQTKDGIFSLGWTEEHSGSDLLSVKTQATPLSDDPNERRFHIKGRKWLINNGYHADYHMVVAKLDPEQDGPRSLSLFLVPRSSTKNWERLESHVLRNMVLATFEIDGPGTLVGKRGHGLSILQRMAMPSKYQASHVGMRMVYNAVRATIDHLSTKQIFKENPINFGNVFRQLYEINLEASFIDFLYHRALAFSDSSFLQFYGTMLKSFLLLRANAVLAQNWLVAGSKGFLRESVIGRNAIDSFVLPVFDGHYTINTLISVKHMDRYLNATRSVNPAERIEYLRNRLYISQPGDQINRSPREIRHPDFFDYADYIRQLNIPLNWDASVTIEAIRKLQAEINERGIAGDPEYRYKLGDLLHWVEATLAAAEMWATLEDDRYLNVIVQQHNMMVNAFNAIIAEGNLETDFLTPLRQKPLPEVEDRAAFLYDLLDIESKVAALRAEPAKS